MEPVRPVDPSDLGAAVADVSDRISDTSGRVAVDRARRAFLAPPVRRALPGRPRVLVLVAAACAAVLAAFLWLSAGPRPLTYRVADRAGAVGEWVAAEAASPLTLRFSDESTLALAAGARARVTTTNARGADVLIERGGVHATIAHASRATRWAVRAGPFEVRVTGTVFDASWDPTTESFELTMHEGAVVVSGPHIPPERAVVAGERLRVSVREGRMELTTGPVSVDGVARPQPRVPDPAPQPCAAPVVTAAPKVDAAPPIDAAPRPQPEAPAWKELAARGKYREALAAAEGAGFEHEVAHASSADLLLLADAARLGGSPARARVALLAARSRFGARGHTAFLLGKIAADQGGSAGDAASWMETYLREDPRGAFAEQALGRLVELSRRDPEAASRAAARYLARYPNGAHAALARSLVADKTQAP
jgi:hypothetical protein